MLVLFLGALRILLGSGVIFVMKLLKYIDSKKVHIFVVGMLSAFSISVLVVGILVSRAKADDSIVFAAAAMPICAISIDSKLLDFNVESVSPTMIGSFGKGAIQQLVNELTKILKQLFKFLLSISCSIVKAAGFTCR